MVLAVNLAEVVALADRAPDPPFDRLVRGAPAAGRTPSAG